MSIDHRQALIAQFSQFMAGKLSVDDWKTITRTFGTGEIAENVNRFYRSKFFNDNDEARRTIDFLEKVRGKDEEIAFAIMKQAYDLAEGPTQEELEKYPALTMLENGEISSGEMSFASIPDQSRPIIDIDNISGTFYPNLINQINQSYKFGIYDGALVLSRKLLENLLIDILRAKYGTEEINLYYDTNNKRFQPFYELVYNFEENLGDFEHHSNAFDSDFIERLDTFRQTANRSAHSLETNLTDEKIEKYGSEVEYLTRVLFRVKESIK